MVGYMACGRLSIKKIEQYFSLVERVLPKKEVGGMESMLGRSAECTFVAMCAAFFFFF